MARQLAPELAAARMRMLRSGFVDTCALLVARDYDLKTSR
jgi:hypothetical protein